jgi:hypothetical protein
MRNAIVGLAAFCALGACNQREASGAPPPPHGRYIGVGTYSANRLWAHLQGAPQPPDKAKATLADDQQIIVVVDSVTGEVRECGDMSGYCVTMNPWRTPAQAAPAALARHAAELDAERAADKPPPIAENEAERAAPQGNHAR